MVATCMVLGASASSAAAKTVEQADSGSTVSLVAGETLTIDLKPADSASSGHHWRVATKPKRSLLRLRSNRAVNNRAAQRFTYAARGDGATRLRLQYVPPTRGARATSTFRLFVIVNRPIERPRCPSPTDPRIVAQGAKAHVFTVRRTVVARYASGARRIGYTAWYGCEIGSDLAYQLHGAPERPEQIGPDQVANLAIRGTTVGYVYTAGCPFGPGFDGACADRSVSVVESQDLRTGAVLRSIGVASGPQPVNSVTGLVVSATGGLAWIERGSSAFPTRVLRSDDVPPVKDWMGNEQGTVLDEDEGDLIDLDSLAFDGKDVTWVRGGEKRSAPLR